MLDSNTIGGMPKQSVFNRIVTFSWVRRSVVVEVICFLFILLFVYAAVSKLIDYQKFRVQLGQSPMLTAFAGWVAWVIPAVEVLVALLLAMPRYKLIGLFFSFGLMTMFTTYIILITNFSDYIPCSCGGILQDLTWNQHLIFNLNFVLFALIGALWYDKPSH